MYLNISVTIHFSRQERQYLTIPGILVDYHPRNGNQTWALARFRGFTNVPIATMFELKNFKYTIIEKYAFLSSVC